MSLFVQPYLRIIRKSPFSDAARVFDSELLLEIIDQLAEQIKPKAPDKKLNDIKQILTLVDGTLFTALPKTVDALWKDDDHKGYKAHVHYELFKSVPVKLTLTDANTSERQVLLDNLEKNRLYVLDRGYGSYQLMQDIIDASCSGQATIGQSKNNSNYKDCSFKNEYAADFDWQKLLRIQSLIKT